MSKGEGGFYLLELCQGCPWWRLGVKRGTTAFAVGKKNLDGSPTRGRSVTSPGVTREDKTCDIYFI